MRNFIHHIKNTRTPHERRTHALQVAGVLTALVFVGWVGTLGSRLGGNDAVADGNLPDNTAGQTTLPAGSTDLTASAAAAQQNNAAHLEVSTTSVYSQ